MNEKLQDVTLSLEIRQDSDNFERVEAKATILQLQARSDEQIIDEFIRPILAQLRATSPALRQQTQ